MLITSWQTFNSGWYWVTLLVLALCGAAAWGFIATDYYGGHKGRGADNFLNLLMVIGLIFIARQWQMPKAYRTTRSVLAGMVSLRVWSTLFLFVALFVGMLTLVGALGKLKLDSWLVLPLLLVAVFILSNLLGLLFRALRPDFSVKAVSLKDVFFPRIGFTLLMLIFYGVAVVVGALIEKLAPPGVNTWAGLANALAFMLVIPPMTTLGMACFVGVDPAGWVVEPLKEGKFASPATALRPKKVWYGAGAAAALGLAFFTGYIINAPTGTNIDVAKSASLKQPEEPAPVAEPVVDFAVLKAEQAKQARLRYKAEDYGKAYQLALAAAEGEGANADAQLLLYQLGPNPAALERFKMPTNGNPAQIAAAAKEKLDMSAKASLTKQQAIGWLTKAAVQGHAKANAYLGAQYLFGSSVTPKNYEKALKYIRYGAEEGSDHAQENLGYMYQEGLGVGKNIGTAFTWYKRAADSGSASAMRAVAWSYDQGWGVSKNLAMAYDYFRKAADAGDAEAQSELGHRLISGIGTPKDYRAARYWLAQAARQNDAIAMRNLGVLYDNGYGVTVDKVQAVKLFMLSAENGDRNGAYYAANGLWGLVKHDSRYSNLIRKYYKMADDLGHPDAARTLADYNVGARIVGYFESLAVRSLGPLATGDAQAIKNIMNEQYQLMDQIIERAVQK